MRRRLNRIDGDDADRPRGENTVVVVTPALKYGSWSWFEDIVRHSSKTSWVIVGYGDRPVEELCNAKWVTLPGANYLRFGRFAARPYCRWMNFAYVIPLVVIATVYCWRYKPATIVGNGIAAASLLALCRLTMKRGRVWLAYHGAIGHLPSGGRYVIRLLLARVDGAVCNSIGNAQELRQVMPKRAIVPVVHWADEIFFEGTVVDRKLSVPLRVLFVGRTDPEKFAQCRRVCMALAEEGLVELIVVGAPPDGRVVPWLRFIGYVSTRARMKQLYEEADVVWAPADVDYLSRPGVEALASGCPVVISDIPAVDGKCDGSIRIPRDLVPNSVGVVVNGTDDAEILALFRQWALGYGIPGQRAACRAYAAIHYSVNNIKSIADCWSLKGVEFKC